MTATRDRPADLPTPATDTTRPSGPVGPRPPIAYVRVLAFVVGSASLGAEIAAARLLAPYFGASTIIWANTIATVLVALSVGYAIGGRIADRWPHLRGLCTVVMAAGLLLAVVPFAADPFLRLASSALGALSVGGFLSSLVAVLGLVAVPVVLLGTVAPFANRLAVDRLVTTGTVTGRLYAISTIGSLVGTFASALLMIPLIGTHRTFLVFALALVAVAAPGLRLRALLLAPIVVGGLLAIPEPGIGTNIAGARVIYSAETPYQSARVLQLPSGERWLELNEGVAIHSDYRPWSYLTGGYWDDFLVLPLAAGQAPGHIAILGDAAGTVARAYGHYFPRTRVDAVELDGRLTDIGRRYFDLRGPNLHLYTADARPWLAASTSRYDAIFLDAYRQPYIPFYLVTREFFASVASHLRPGGVVVVNVGHTPGSDALEKVVTATLGAEFPVVVRDRVSATNSLVMASRRPLGSINRARVGAELSPLAVSVESRLGPRLTGGTVYTDDRAPVEWLTDFSLLRYAAGDR